MFKAIYRGMNGERGLQYGNTYTFSVKESLLGRGFSILVHDATKMEYADMQAFISDWGEIEIG